MPSFKSKLLSAFAWTAPVLAAVLPSHQPAVTRAEGTIGKILNYDLQQNYAQATFSIPCTGCLGTEHHTDQDDESLILDFKSHSQENACGSSNITLNGVYLPQEWNGDFASGSGSYSGVTDLEQHEKFHQRDLDLEWKSVCLHGDEETDEAAQVLTVNIKAVDGKALSIPSGFTVSFKQHTSPPSLLRLESVPNPSASDKEVAQSWREPPLHLRVSFLNDTAGPQPEQFSEPSLEDHIRELKELQTEVRYLQEAIANKKKYINAQLRKEVKEFTEDLSECETISCFFKTIGHKAHGAWRIAVIRFQRNHKSELATMGRPDQDVYAQVHEHSSQLSGGRINAEVLQTAPSYTEELPPRPAKAAPYIIALEITLSILCCGCLVAVIRHKCSSLRTRTERAAAREERNNVRAYRKAARCHAWRNWWRGNWRRDQNRIADYEEKRSLIQEQEGVLENAMQEEIRQLRAAHDVVNDLVRDAEEGRVSGHTPCNCHRAAHPVAPYPVAPYSPSLASTYPPTSIPEAPSRPLSRTDSLPSYRSDPPSEPPNYDSEVDMSEIVANGFRHYRSSSGSEITSHWTPDSSVVDVSPRPSADTLRYPQSIVTCEEESDED